LPENIIYPLSSASATAPAWQAGRQDRLVLRSIQRRRMAAEQKITASNGFHAAIRRFHEQQRVWRSLGNFEKFWEGLENFGRTLPPNMYANFAVKSSQQSKKYEQRLGFWQDGIEGSGFVKLRRDKVYDPPTPRLRRTS